VPLQILRPCRFNSDTRGFSLVEVLFAIGLLGGALAVLVQLFLLSARANTAAHTATMSALLASSKMEELRGSPLAPSSALGHPLQENVAGFCDFFDGRAQPLSGGPPPPRGTVYIRRWSIEPLSADAGRTLLLQVRVIDAATDARAGMPAQRSRQPGESRLLSLMTAKER
jgi:hypothetical protein